MHVITEIHLRLNQSVNLATPTQSPECWCKEDTDVPNVNSEVESVEHMVNKTRCDHQTWIYLVKKRKNILVKTTVICNHVRNTMKYHALWLLSTCFFIKQ